MSKTQLVFWISQNRLLEPCMASTSSYTGKIEYERVNVFECYAGGRLKLAFDRHFGTKTESNGDLRQWSFLVAITEVEVAANSVDLIKSQILPDIDDLLLIASFAARTRTACLGWTACDDKSLATFYRGNYAFPKLNEATDRDDSTIERVDFMEFIETASNAFLNYENKLALRNSLHAAVPSRSDTLEGSFLKMFAGLETLVLDFRRRENLEYVMPPPAWKEFRKHLQRSIRESTGPKLTSGQRDSIYRKLGELNRISLHEAFDELCKAYCIDLSDLWPVFESKTGIGLSEIRNRIVHGDPFPHDFISPLSIANEHLRYTIERVIIRIFGWNIDRTKVSRAYLLRNRLSIGELPAAQAEIGELLGPQQKGVQM